MLSGRAHYVMAARLKKGESNPMGGKTSTAAELKWAKANRKQFNVQLPIPFYSELTDMIKTHGESYYEFLLAAYQAAKDGKF